MLFYKFRIMNFTVNFTYIPIISIKNAFLRILLFKPSNHICIRYSAMLVVTYIGYDCFPYPLILTLLLVEFGKDSANIVNCDCKCICNIT